MSGGAKGAAATPWTPARGPEASWRSQPVTVLTLSECGHYARVRLDDSFMARTALVLTSELSARAAAPAKRPCSI